MIIKCGGIYAAEYTKAEVDEMLKQMSAFQKGISLQKATERFMTGERARPGWASTSSAFRLHALSTSRSRRPMQTASSG